VLAPVWIRVYSLARGRFCVGALAVAVGLGAVKLDRAPSGPC
jgi:hypothetical protein